MSMNSEILNYTIAPKNSFITYDALFSYHSKKSI